MEELFNTTAFRRAAHLGNAIFHSVEPIELALSNDIMASVKGWIEILINSVSPRYKVLFYNGQLDIIVAYPFTVNFLKTLKWTGEEAYKTAPRSFRYYQNRLAGYVKHVENLNEVLVLNAEHKVPISQSEGAFDLITKFTRNAL
ncbi:hypothetical protein M8J77_012938 [Diaphorina citri]|nr:hypothetical protein M8J77_012938 [Diaphorina citri]